MNAVFSLRFIRSGVTAWNSTLSSLLAAFIFSFIAEQKIRNFLSIIEKHKNSYLPFLVIVGECFFFEAFGNGSGDGASLEASSIDLSPGRFAFEIFVGAFDWSFSGSFGRVFFLVDSFLYFWAFVGSIILTAGKSSVLPVSSESSDWSSKVQLHHKKC